MAQAHPVGTGSAAAPRWGRRLLVVVAHPDDESFGCGSVIADAVAGGTEVLVACAGLGEAGEVAPGFDLAGRALADVRRSELEAAAAELGARCLPPMGLADSGWDGPPPAGSLCEVDLEVPARMVAALVDELEPDVVLTLAGDDGHRDHVRMAEAVGRAVLGTDLEPGRVASGGTVRGSVSALYQWCLPNHLMRRWGEETARLRPDTAHLAVGPASLGTPRERLTTIVDTSEHLPLRRAAMTRHASQTSPYVGLSPQLEADFLETDHLIRVWPPG